MILKRLFEHENIELVKKEDLLPDCGIKRDIDISDKIKENRVTDKSESTRETYPYSEENLNETKKIPHTGATEFPKMRIVATIPFFFL